MKNIQRCALFALFLTLIACQPKNNSSSISDAKQFFSAYSQGLLQEKEPFIFRLLQGPKANTSTLESAIKLSPNTPIQISYDSIRHEIKVVPVTSWKRGETYNISFDLHQGLIDGPKSSFTSSFQIHRQEIDVIRQGIIINQDQKASTQLVVHAFLDETSESISTIFDHPKEKIRVQTITSQEFHVFLESNFSQGEEEVSWNASSLSAHDKGTVRLYAYNPNVFEVVNTHFNRYQKKYLIYFSQWIESPKEKTGLITLDQADVSFEINQNLLTVYVNNNSKEVVTLSVDKALKSVKGLSLKSSLSYSIEMEIVRPDVNWVNDGTYIPSSGQFKIPFRAIGLKSVILQVIKTPSVNTSRFAAWNNLSSVDLSEIKRYGRLEIEKTIPLTSNPVAAESWNEYGLDLTELFEREDGMVYTILLGFHPSNTILNCEDPYLKEYESRQLKKEFFDEPYTYFYADNYRSQYRYNPCDESYYNSHPPIIKNIHCTNVFPIIKSGENKTLVALKELTTNQLAAQAQVTLLNLQGLDIASGTTSSEGMVWFENLPSSAKAMRVSYGGNTSYYNLSESNVLSLTEFDVSSNVRDIDNRIFVYTERDIWRPGDSIFLDVMLNKSKFHFEEGLPISVKLYNPKSVLSFASVQNISDHSIYSFALPTDLEAPTGYWNAKIKIGPHYKNVSLRVETIKPNVVEAIYDIKNEKDQWIYNAQFSGDIQVDYLAGYPMKNGKINVGIVAQPIQSPFSEYRNFSFTPTSVPAPYKNENFFSSKTSDTGKASFNSKFDFKELKSVSRLIVDSKIDLPGGGLNTQTRTYLISPFSQYVGIEKVRGRGWRGSFNFGENPNIPLIHLNEKGEPLTGNSVADIRVYHYKKDWWYDRYRMSRDYSYQQSHLYELKWEEKANFVNGEYNFKHPLDTLKSGTYLIMVTDPQSGHVSQYTYHAVSTEDYVAPSNPQIIQLATDKEEYETNEEIIVDLPQISGAKALVSIEVGEKIKDVFWADLNSPNLRIKVDETWTPNIYLNLHVVQPYETVDNDRPMRMYAVKKIRINTTENALVPIISAPEKSLPNAPLTINIKENEGKEMEYTIALVDEGLLNITGFNTPSPQEHFNKMIALRIKTWDIFSELIHYLNPSFAGIISIGGDAALNKLLDESADFNRFEPVVFHAGPFTLDKKQTKEHQFDIPNYIGRLRVMVVAAGTSQFGSSEENVRIASPLMVQTQLPRALNVSDTVNVPVTIFKDDENISKVQLSIQEKNGKIQILNPSSTLDLSTEEQITTTAQLVIGDDAGEAELSINASAGSHNSSEDTKIFINYPYGYTNTGNYYTISSGDSDSYPVSSFGFPSTKNLDIIVSGRLLPDFTSMYKDMIEYPHGCLEQLTSKGMSLLYIDDLISLNVQERNAQLDVLDASITKIQSYQRSDGSFSYWPGSNSHPWSDVYVGLFLHLASEKGFTISNEVLNKWSENMIKIANSWRLEGQMSSSYVQRREEQLQAFRLYTLARLGKAQKGAMNRFRQRTDLKELTKLLLGGAYHYAGLSDIAETLVSSAIQSGIIDQNYYFWGSRIRSSALAITIGSEVTPQLISDRYFRDWVENVNQRRWLSTQDKGFCFLASHTYYKDEAPIATEIEFEIISDKYKERIKLPQDKSKRYHWTSTELTGTARIVNHGESDINVYRLERAISNDMKQSATAQNLKMNVTYALPDGSNPLAKAIDQGEEIQITVQIENESLVDLDDMALSVKMPSGWELLNPRIFESAKLINDGFVYQDFKDDRVYTYFTMGKSGSAKIKTYRFKARAQLKGHFYLPAVAVTDMYNLDVQAQSLSHRVTVK